jgi:hypothetical protein
VQAVCAILGQNNDNPVKYSGKTVFVKSTDDKIMLLTMAQFELRLIQDRTRAGLEAARDRGRTGGRLWIEIEETKVLAAKSCRPINRSRSTSSVKPCGFPGPPTIASYS